MMLFRQQKKFFNVYNVNRVNKMTFYLHYVAQNINFVQNVHHLY